MSPRQHGALHLGKRKRNGTINCLPNYFFFRLVEMKTLTGPWLSAVLPLLTMCCAPCVIKAFPLQRLSRMPCTATVSWDRRLARTAQVCHESCSLCLSTSLLLAARCCSLVPLGMFGAWPGMEESCSLCLVPSSKLAGRVLSEVLLFPVSPAQRHLLSD